MNGVKEERAARVKEERANIEAAKRVKMERATGVMGERVKDVPVYTQKEQGNEGGLNAILTG